MGESWESSTGGEFEDSYDRFDVGLFLLDLIVEVLIELFDDELIRLGPLNMEGKVRKARVQRAHHRPDIKNRVEAVEVSFQIFDRKGTILLLTHTLTWNLDRQRRH